MLLYEVIQNDKSHIFVRRLGKKEGQNLYSNKRFRDIKEIRKEKLKKLQNE
jgi:hypothetical protein